MGQIAELRRFHPFPDQLAQQLMAALGAGVKLVVDEVALYHYDDRRDLMNGR